MTATLAPYAPPIQTVHPAFFPLHPDTRRRLMEYYNEGEPWLSTAPPPTQRWPEYRKRDGITMCPWGGFLRMLGIPARTVTVGEPFSVTGVFLTTFPSTGKGVIEILWHYAELADDNYNHCELAEYAIVLQEYTDHITAFMDEFDQGHITLAQALGFA